MESSDDIDGFVHFQGFLVHMQHKENREVVGFFFSYIAFLLFVVTVI